MAMYMRIFHRKYIFAGSIGSVFLKVVETFIFVCKHFDTFKDAAIFNIKYSYIDIVIFLTKSHTLYLDGCGLLHTCANLFLFLMLEMLFPLTQKSGAIRISWLLTTIMIKKPVLANMLSYSSRNNCSRLL